jgi:hypothetical protein
MDAEIILAERSPRAVNKTEPGVTAAIGRPPNIHHFIFYGQASRNDVAAFAAAKVFLESAVYPAPRETDSRVAKAGPKAGLDGRHYVVRLPIKGQIAARGIDLIGKVSDAEEAQSRLVLTVRLDPKQSGNMPTSFDHRGWPGSRIYDLTVVNRSIIHCVRALSDKSGTVA